MRVCSAAASRLLDGRLTVTLCQPLTVVSVSAQPHPSGVTWLCQHCTAGPPAALATPARAPPTPSMPPRDASEGRASPGELEPQPVDDNAASPTPAKASGPAGAGLADTAHTPTRLRVGDFDLDELDWADSP